MRLFVAIDLPSEVRHRIAALQREMRVLRLPVRWVPADRIHLTLRFIGEVAAQPAEAIGAALQEGATHEAGPFRLRTGRIGTFPDRERPRVIWIGVKDEDGAVARLAGGVDAAVQSLGLAFEPRPFRPHLTLGRFTGPAGRDWRAGLERFTEATAGEFEVDRFHLYESRLARDGATYRILSSYMLCGEATL